MTTTRSTRNLTSSQLAALGRAAAHVGAWTPRRLHARTVDVAVLVDAGLVRQLGVVGHGVALHEITQLGRALAEAIAARGTRRSR